MLLLQSPLFSNFIYSNFFSILFSYFLILVCYNLTLLITLPLPSFNLCRGCSNSFLENNKSFYESHKEVLGSASVGGEKSDSHILRHFFDDWPRSDNGRGDNNVSQQMNSTSPSATSLSISIPANLSSSSDVSLKLSTGGSSDQGSGHHIHEDANADREEHAQLNWAAGWAATQMASMGGPLAEALRSANNNSSPTSVLLHRLQRATNSEASFIST